MRFLRRIFFNPMSFNLMVENEKKRRFRVDWLVYVLASAVLVGLLIWATRGELSRNPSRDSTVDLGSNGFFTIATNLLVPESLSRCRITAGCLGLAPSSQPLGIGGRVPK